MRLSIIRLSKGLGVALGALLVASAPGQQPTAPLPAPVIRPPAVTTAPARTVRGVGSESEPAAVKMEIFEGPNRTVRYFGNGSPGEQAMLGDLERAENEMAYLKDLQALRRQYVTSERTVEPMRRYVQEQLYGTSIGTSWTNLQGGVFASGGYGYTPGYAYPYAYPYNYGGYGYPGMTAYLGGSSTEIMRSLAYGVGDEGCLKNAIAPVIAQQAGSADYQAAVRRNYTTAMGHVASSPQLAKALDLTPEKGGGSTVVPAAAETDRAFPVMLYLKDGSSVGGDKMTEDGDWYVVEAGKTEHRVRKSEVVRIVRPK
jgi:hypothetical protein